MSSKQTDQDGHVAQTDDGALQALGLEAKEIASLRRKGTITQERRGRDTIIFKLRFRIAARQRVKYLGTDRHVVEQIRAELNDLQAAHRRSRRLRRLDAQARTLMRDTKLRLENRLEQAGLKFHGRAIRRPRNRNDVLNPSNPST